MSAKRIDQVAHDGALTDQAVALVRAAALKNTISPEDYETLCTKVADLRDQCYVPSLLGSIVENPLVRLQSKIR